jgi:hypothetical protein
MITKQVHKNDLLQLSYLQPGIAKGKIYATLKTSSKPKRVSRSEEISDSAQEEKQSKYLRCMRNLLKLMLSI